MKLKNGLQIVTEKLPEMRSASIGVWVRAGSIFESADENGLSHYLEHMAFKGTADRSARQIAEAMDAIGGQVNAATSKLCTDYYARVIDESLPQAVKLLADLVVNPVLNADEVEKERGVILEEIAMEDDSPEDKVFDLLDTAVFGTQSLGHTVLGPAERIRKYSRDELMNFRHRYYRPENAVIAVVGSFDDKALCGLLNEQFGVWENAEGYTSIFPDCAPAGKNTCVAENAKTEQVHLCMAYRASELGSDLMYNEAVLNNIVGGGMASRLFQRIREELGLAYSVYSSPTVYPNCGEFTVYAATSEKNVPKVAGEISREIQKLIDNGITKKEFEQAKLQVKTGYILGLESAYSRMDAMGVNQLLLNRNKSPEEVIRAIDLVTPDDVMKQARQIFIGHRYSAILGPHAGKYEKYLL